MTWQAKADAFVARFFCGGGAVTRARDQVWAELLPLRSVALYETARLLPPCPPASWLKVPVTVASAARLRPSQS